MARLKANTFDGLRHILEDRPSATIGHNTTATRVGEGSYSVQLHGSEIVTLSENGKIATISTAGWDTVTTRERINQFIGPVARVHRVRGDLAVTIRGERVLKDWDGLPLTLDLWKGEIV